VSAVVNSSNSEDWSPIPLKNVIQGHLTTEALMIPVYLLAGWLIGLIVASARIPFETLFIVVTLSALVGAVPNAWILHVCSARERTDDPSPWYLGLQAICLACVASVLMILVNHAGVPALAVALVMGVVSLVVNLLMMPKKPLSRQEVAQKMEQTSQMTQEVFADEISHAHEEQQRKLDDINRKHGIDKLH
jgi:flagellar biosynthesis component FlhA